MSLMLICDIIEKATSTKVNHRPRRLYSILISHGFGFNQLRLLSVSAVLVCFCFVWCYWQVCYSHDVHATPRDTMCVSTAVFPHCHKHLCLLKAPRHVWSAPCLASPLPGYWSQLLTSWFLLLNGDLSSSKEIPLTSWCTALLGSHNKYKREIERNGSKKKVSRIDKEVAQN